ncbi:MAG: DUF2828 domain-containing protein, partial [Polyangiaceae bacterium]|nr:DUF2828 domain-containing protein [Polyangiaceae bacterium]
ELILNIAVQGKLKQNEMPEQVLIVSDMQFDQGAEGWNETLFQSIQRMFAEHGYVLPKLSFWNVGHSKTTPIPVKDNALGLTLISGFSLHTFEMVMGNDLEPEMAIRRLLRKYDEVFDSVG